MSILSFILTRSMIMNSRKTKEIQKVKDKHPDLFISEFWHPSIATDVALFTLREGRLCILLIKRKIEKTWALPGGFLIKGESLDACAKRELEEETGVKDAILKHFKNYSNPRRDYRGQIISAAYFAIHPSGKLRISAASDAIDVKWCVYDDIPNNLAFDHNIICKDAFKEVQKVIIEKPQLAFGFLKDEFTLTELHNAFLSIAGDKFRFKEKRNFRKWISEFDEGSGMVKETGNMKRGKQRPAMMYSPRIAADKEIFD